MSIDVISQFKSSITGRVRNTTLATNRALWPLFEVISNGIHAIEELQENRPDLDGEITIEILRLGSETFRKNPNVDPNNYPVKGFIITDNGIGLNVENWSSFLTADTEKKLKKGAKGVGRFVCLKAFKNVEFESWFKHEGDFYHRSFKFKNEGNGIFEHATPLANSLGKEGTKVTLGSCLEKYEKWIPQNTTDVGLRIIEHFLPYFLTSSIPHIKLIDANGDLYDLNKMYHTMVVGKVESEPFEVGQQSFDLSLLKVKAQPKEKTHKIYFCGNNREVTDKKLKDYIPDLDATVYEDGHEMIYKAYVTSEFLDDHISQERTGFTFNNDDEEDDPDQTDSMPEYSFRNIRNAAIIVIESLLKDYLESVRAVKVEKYTNHILEESPQFRSLISYKPEGVAKIKPGLKGSNLDVELFKLQQEWELEIKNTGEEVFAEIETVENFEEYKEQYMDYVEQLNASGQSQLAKYIVHRKSVLDLLDKFLGRLDDEKFKEEDTIHNLFFPIRKLSDEVPHHQQNLWLLDERFTYHSYLASDKRLKSNKNIETESKDRPDLLLFKHKFSFVETDYPYNGFVIVEFKRPERADYTIDYEKKNPVDQVLKYIKDIRDSKVKTRDNKIVNFKEGAYFYAYIVCDFNNNLRDILELRDFTPLPDGERYYNYYSTVKAMIEVVSYKQVLSDARKRNNILFDKLGINQRR